MATYNLADIDYEKGGTQKSHYTKEDVENCSCPYCNQTQSHHIYTERGSITVVKCDNCDLIYINPRAKEAEKNYFGNAEIFYREAEQIFKGNLKHHRDKNYEYEIKQIKKYKKQGKFLDIGTFMGFFLRKAKEAGFETQGVEPSPAAAEIASREFGLIIKNAYFNHTDFEPKHFDVITMIDVFEHVSTPIALLKSVRESLKDDGILCIKVPNGKYNLFKLQLAGKNAGNYEIFDAYEHLVHYTTKTMKKMLAKADFKIEKIIIPLPIHCPIWPNLVGHIYQYPSPWILDWKRVLLRNIFYSIGKFENFIGLEPRFAPDLMFVIKRNCNSKGFGED